MINVARKAERERNGCQRSDNGHWPTCIHPHQFSGELRGSDGDAQMADLGLNASSDAVNSAAATSAEELLEIVRREYRAIRTG